MAGEQPKTVTVECPMCKARTDVELWAYNFTGGIKCWAHRCWMVVVPKDDGPQA